MNVRIKKFVRVTTMKYSYELSERYSIDEIFNKVIDANDHMMLKLYNVKNEPIYIRASKIESIEVIAEQYAVI